MKTSLLEKEKDLSSPKTDTPFKRKSYDTDVTFKLKAAGLYNTITRMIGIINGDVISLHQLITDGKFTTLENAYNLITEEYPSFLLEDIVMIWYDTSGSNEAKMRSYREIKSLYQTFGETRYPEIKDLEEAYQTWLDRYDRVRISERAKLDTLMVIEKNFDGIPDKELERSFKVENLTTSRMSLNLSPTLKLQSFESSKKPESLGRPVNPLDGIDIFNEAKVSKFVPYIQYNYKSEDQSDGRSDGRFDGRAEGRGSKKERGVQRWYKLYRGDKMDITDRKIPYEKIIPAGAAVTKPDTIYFTLWLGDENKVDFFNAPKDTFHEMVYDLTDNEITIRETTRSDKQVQDNKIILERIQNAFPNLQTTLSEDEMFSGYFHMPLESQLDDTLLVYIILNSPLVNFYFYVDETIKPYALKKRFDFHLRADVTSEVPSATESGMRIGLAGNLDVNMRKAPNIRTTNSFIEIFRRVLFLYQTSLAQPIYQDYINVFGDDFYNSFPNNIIRESGTLELNMMGKETESSQEPQTPRSRESHETQKMQTSRGRGKDRLADLQAKAPDLFISRYSKECMSKVQPIIIQPEAVESFKKESFMHKGTYTNREVIYFPRDNPEWIFGCPGNEAPFPGVKVNKLERNKIKYPYIPCCYATKQTDLASNTDYARYYGGKETIDVSTTKSTTKSGGVSTTKSSGVVTTKSSNKDLEGKKEQGTPSSEAKSFLTLSTSEPKGKTEKILPETRFGYLPLAVEALLRKYSAPVEGKMERFGVLRSPNSFLHCVLLAIQEEEYLGLKTTSEREVYVEKERSRIAKETKIDLYRQELYDQKEQDIAKSLADNKIFFDPAIWYRGVEETYGINVYTFTPPLSGVSDISNSGHLELPRHKIFHVRPLRADRPTVCILKNRGMESERLTYPQCELIVDRGIAGTKSRFVDASFGSSLFDEKMTNLCHQALMTTQEVVSWLNEAEIYPRLNLYSVVDWFAILKNTSRFQFIDTYGKVRALLVPLGSQTSKTSELVTFVIPPSQPENLPRVEKVISLPEAESILTLSPFSKPVAVALNIKREVTGFWYSALDVMYAFLVLVKPFRTEEKIRIGPNNPLETSDYNYSERVHILQRTNNIIMQIVYHLYSLEFDLRQRRISPESFASDFFLIGNVSPSVDSSTVYDLKGIGHKFPQAANASQILREYYQSTKSNLFASEKDVSNEKSATVKLYLYNKEFARKIVYHLGWYDTALRSTAATVPRSEEVISNYFADASEFKQDSNTIIFLKEEEMKTWLDNLTSEEKRPLIHTKIDQQTNDVSKNMAFMSEPYLFRNTTTDEFYLIQNVTGGIENALYLALQWRNTRVNQREVKNRDIKPREEREIRDLGHLLYSISAGRELQISEDNRPKVDIKANLEEDNKEVDGTLRILKYVLSSTNVRYGAMFPLFSRKPIYNILTFDLEEKARTFLVRTAESQVYQIVNSEDGSLNSAKRVIRNYLGTKEREKEDKSQAFGLYALNPKRVVIFLNRTIGRESSASSVDQISQPSILNYSIYNIDKNTTLKESERYAAMLPV